MDDLNQMISQIMSDPDAMAQLQSVAASLGLGGNSAPQNAPPPPNPQPPPQNTGGVDLSALSSLLGGLGQPAAPQQQQQQSSVPDLSALSGLLSGLSSQSAPAPTGGMDLSSIASLLGLGQNQPAPVQNSAPNLSSLAGILGNLTGGAQQAPSNNVSALTSLLSNGNPPAQAPSGGFLPNFDMSTILKLSNALSSVQANRQNIDLLLALKPRLKTDRARKIDDAIRVMQLVQFLPLIKESGLFGEMDNILGGLGNIVGGNGLGGLGNLLGGLGRR